METGKYKDKSGGELNVVQVDEAANLVLVDYGGGHTKWYGREDYSTWAFVPEETEVDAGEKVLDYQEQPTESKAKPVAEVQDEEPPAEEIKPEPKKRGRKKKSE